MSKHDTSQCVKAKKAKVNQQIKASRVERQNKVAKQNEPNKAKQSKTEKSKAKQSVDTATHSHGQHMQNPNSGHNELGKWQQKTVANHFEMVSLEFKSVTQKSARQKSFDWSVQHSELVASCET